MKKDIKEYAYVGLKKCGCMVGFIIDIPENASCIGKGLKRNIEAGCYIQRVPVLEMDTWRKHCSCSSGKYAYAGVKPCGCIDACIEDSPENADRIVAELQQYLNMGCHIERKPLIDMETYSCRTCLMKAIDSNTHQAPNASEPFCRREEY